MRQRRWPWILFIEQFARSFGHRTLALDLEQTLVVKSISGASRRPTKVHSRSPNSMNEVNVHSFNVRSQLRFSATLDSWFCLQSKEAIWNTRKRVRIRSEKGKVFVWNASSLSHCVCHRLMVNHMLSQIVCLTNRAAIALSQYRLCLCFRLCCCQSVFWFYPATCFAMTLTFRVHQYILEWMCSLIG